MNSPAVSSDPLVGAGLKTSRGHARHQVPSELAEPPQRIVWRLHRFSLAGRLCSGALGDRTDIARTSRHVRLVPEADILAITGDLQERRDRQTRAHTSLGTVIEPLD
jgi:hypothetical protein